MTNPEHNISPLNAFPKEGDTGINDYAEFEEESERIYETDKAEQLFLEHSNNEPTLPTERLFPLVESLEVTLYGDDFQRVTQALSEPDATTGQSMIDCTTFTNWYIEWMFGKSETLTTNPYEQQFDNDDDQFVVSSSDEDDDPERQTTSPGAKVASSIGVNVLPSEVEAVEHPPQNPNANTSFGQGSASFLSNAFPMPSYGFSFGISPTHTSPQAPLTPLFGGAGGASSPKSLFGNASLFGEPPAAPTTAKPTNCVVPVTDSANKKNTSLTASAVKKEFVTVETMPCRRKAAKVFDAFDTDKKGCISVQKFEDMVDELGEGFHGDEFDKALLACIGDDENLLDRSNFIEWYEGLVTTNANKEDNDSIDSDELAERAEEVEKVEKAFEKLGVMEIESGNSGKDVLAISAENFKDLMEELCLDWQKQLGKTTFLYAYIML